MKTQISRERLFDSRLRALVARQEYIDALRYYRDTFKAPREEAKEAIDFVREQLDKERDSGAAPATIGEWSPSLAPQPASKKVAAPSAEDEESDEGDEETEQIEASDSTLSNEELAEEEGAPEENPNISPYSLPGAYERPEIDAFKSKNRAKAEEDDLEEEDPEEDDDELEEFEDDELEEDDEELEDDDEELEEDDDLDEEDEPPSPAAKVEEVAPAPRVEPLPAPVEPAPIVSPVALKPLVAPDEPPAGLPAWGSLPLSLQRELRALSLADAIRLYWEEMGGSLSEAKAYVSYWKAREV